MRCTDRRLHDWHTLADMVAPGRFRRSLVHPVTAPFDALLTSFEYFASTPRA